MQGCHLCWITQISRMSRICIHILITPVNFMHLTDLSINCSVNSVKLFIRDMGHGRPYRGQEARALGKGKTIDSKSAMFYLNKLPHVRRTLHNTVH